MLQSPLFHVNGEDPEAVAQVVQLAIDFRREFKRDVVIDMYCYRRRGHNEADEPTFTQPLWYKTIERTKNVREGYLEYLLKMDGISRVEADAIAARRREQLEKDLSVARSPEFKPRLAPWTGLWAGYRGGPESEAEELNTGVSREKLASYLDTLASVPADFNVVVPAYMKEVIAEISRVSKPGRRVYSSISDLKPIKNGLGISILSTSKGVMSDAAAREANVGGEVLCKVY